MAEKESTLKQGFFYQKVIKPLIEQEGTPESLALGAAVGMFIALTPTVGIQMTVAVITGTLINRYTRWTMNRLVAVAMCWISNPITMLPMYYIDLWLGWILTGRGWMPPMNLEGWQRQFSSYLQRDPSQMTVWDQVKGFVMAGLGELAVPMWIGSLIIATLIAIPTYPVTLAIVRRYRARKDKTAEPTIPPETTP
ncbi:MAG: DUF2062 domain-containing protein [Myxococcales bacterium]|nr:DUF2062 domain-containing protein [Myxococcales bacterium]